MLKHFNNHVLKKCTNQCITVFDKQTVGANILCITQVSL